MVVLRRVVAAKAADDHHQQQAEADRDVRAVQTRQPEEHGREGTVAGVEADVQVLDDLRAEEREPHEEREHHAREESCSLAALDGLERPVHGEARRHEDARVHSRDEDGELVRRRRPRGPGALGLTTRTKK